MLTNVYLKGRLGQEFGEIWKLDVKTPKEALHAINVNTNGRFMQYIDESIRNRQIGYTFIVGNNAITTKENAILLHGPHGHEDITVTPVIGGAWVQILIEIVVSIILAVVSSLLAPSPNVNLGSNDDSARKDSYLFSGGPQPAKQGKPVPVGYGRMIVYPIAISVQYEYNNIAFGNSPAGYVDGGDGYTNWQDVGGITYTSTQYTTIGGGGGVNTRPGTVVLPVLRD